MRVLVTGGAGYVGSAGVARLVSDGHDVTVVDSLRMGDRDKVDPKATFIQMDLIERSVVFQLFENNNFDAVMHFAAHKEAGESMLDAELYSQNITATINMLDAAVRAGVPHFVNSSSAFVYGQNITMPLTEEQPTIPDNYYGFSKKVGEELVDWYDHIKGIRGVSLRYFNVAGDAGLNYVEKKPANLFPAIQNVLFGKAEALTIFGTNYDTPDGTCIRDYIHIDDVIDAHVRALENTEARGIYNLGSEHGYSVKEIVAAFERVHGVTIPTIEGEPRESDPTILVASSERAKEELGWSPQRSLDDMVSSIHISQTE